MHDSLKFLGHIFFIFLLFLLYIFGQVFLVNTHIRLKVQPNLKSNMMYKLQLHTLALYIPSHIYSHTSTSIAKSSYQRIQIITKPLHHLVVLKFHTFNLRPFLIKMNFRNTSTLLIIFVICVAILSQVGVEATRVLSEDFGNGNQLETHSPIYVKAKEIMAYWLQKLPSGPSPPGEGH